jgi:uncharacterized protein YfbU (UPF0304 family)
MLESAAMKLSRAERWILSNQYKILERLDIAEAKHYAFCRKALECGYEGEYALISLDIYDESDGLSSEECGEVLDILEMYSDMQTSCALLDDKADVDLRQLDFPGFDGNHESKRIGYCRHFCEGRDRYLTLRRARDWDSHMPVIEEYRRMLEVWRPIRQRNHGASLSKRDILEILLVGPDPESSIGRLRDADPQGGVQ